MPRPSSKEDLLTKGAEVIHARGYHATGVAEIAAAAGVPKGSFYNHFESKEAFADAILSRYFETFEEVLVSAFSNDAADGFGRLENFVELIISFILETEFCGCLLGNFAFEASGHSERLRVNVDAFFGRWQTGLRDAFAAGQSDGSLTSVLAPEDMAALFISTWEGAVLRARVSRDPAHLQQFKRIILTQLRA